MTGERTGAMRMQLFDTPAHAATTALAVTAAAAGPLDPVRARTASSIYPLIFDAAAGDGAPARRRAGSVVSLVAESLTALEGATGAEPALVLALERWMLHPQRRTAAELTAVAREVARTSSDNVLLERAWLTGAGVEAAVAALRGANMDDESAAPARSLVAAACEHVVPVVWVARELDVSRNVVYRGLRSVDGQAWRAMLP